MNPANSDTLSIEAIAGALRIAGGTRLADAFTHATVLTPPPRSARGREGERLFILLDLTGSASPSLYRELREVLARTYWFTTGSITAVLRKAAAAANRHLFRTNLRFDPSERCYGSLICAVLHGDDLFIIQAGSARACTLRGEHVESFSPGIELPYLGMGPLADVRLYHTFTAIGDTLLLASLALIQETDDEHIASVLSRGEVQEVLEGLEQIGAGDDFVALVVRWVPVRGVPAARETEQPPRPLTRQAPEPRSRPRIQGWGQWLRRVPKRRKPVRRLVSNLGERVKGAIRYVGHGMAAAGVWFVGLVSTLFRRMLPGPGREARRQARPHRPIPKENRTLMMAIAVGIPIVLAIIVALAYLSFGTETRFQDFIDQAEEEIALAQTLGGISEPSRPHWEAALEQATAAVALRPDDPAAAALQTEAQAALDRLDGITRLTPIQLWDFGLGAVPRRLVVHGQMIFVLDPADGWVVQLTLNPAGDGVVERETALTLLRTGQQVGEGRVGNLVDFAWVGLEGERRTSGLLVLEEDGALVSYDPAWGGEDVVSQLVRSFLGTPPTGMPRVVDSFGGRFYILDTTADQVWRYKPRGDTYPDPPERYFVTPPPKPLEDALDMAIDGNIYILCSDGTILKFLGGEPQPFDVRGLPGDISQAVALAVDPAGSSGALYVADRGNRRVVVLESDGTFKAQLRAEEAFDALEALAVDEASGRLYVFSGGRLYVASGIP